jgi:hypothetical protein
MAISTDHLRRLLEAGDDAQLVVSDGEASVVDPTVAPLPGAVPEGAVVLSAADLRARLAGHDPSDEMLAALARRLDAAADARDT